MSTYLSAPEGVFASAVDAEPSGRHPIFMLVGGCDKMIEYKLPGLRARNCRSCKPGFSGTSRHRDEPFASKFGCGSINNPIKRTMCRGTHWNCWESASQKGLKKQRPKQRFRTS
jgi:hypothetical protein